MNLNQLIDEIEARANAATVGPWYSDENRELVCAESVCAEYDLIAIAEMLVHDDNIVNAEFIAHSRQDVPALIRMLRLALAQRNSMVSANYLGMDQGASIALIKDKIDYDNAELLKAWEGK